MNKSTLALKLKERQLEKNLVPRELILNISDRDIIDCYITCSCCGEKSIEDDNLNKIILASKNVEDFLSITSKKKHI